MSRLAQGTTCPRCKQACYLKKDGTLGVHRTEFYVLGQIRNGRRREICAYSGVTPDEAQAGITLIKKRTAEFLARQKK
jgi:hypothetical protein